MDSFLPSSSKNESELCADWWRETVMKTRVIASVVLLPWLHSNRGVRLPDFASELRQAPYFTRSWASHIFVAMFLLFVSELHYHLRLAVVLVLMSFSCAMSFAFP